MEEELDEIICDCNNLHRSEVVDIVVRRWKNTVNGVVSTRYGLRTCSRCKGEIQRIITETFAQNQVFMHYY